MESVVHGVDWKSNWKDGREEGTLGDALCLELARPHITLMDLRLQAK